MVWRVWRVVVQLLGSAASTLLFGTAAHGQGISATEQAAYMSGIQIDRSMLAGPLATSPRSAMSVGASGGDAGQSVREINLIGSGVKIEMTRFGPDGQFVRPRLLIGRRSHELAAWLRSAGVEPETCILPMFRGRLKRDPDTGKYGAAVLVSGRCTFY